MSAEWTPLVPSAHAQNTTNPIRKIVDQMKAPVGCSKKMIALSIGDPTTDGNFLPPQSTIDAMVANIKSGKANGYAPSVGYPQAREAVARYWVRKFVAETPEAHALISQERVVLGSGASQALLMAITALANPGDNILLPSPGFSLYDTICGSYGIEARHYTCDPERSWESNLDQMKSLADGNTRAILINNPSNPCGSNFSREHVKAIVATAEALKLPIIADEIYAGMVFGGEVFTSVANMDTNVPRFIVGGTAKNFMVPGWRLGWVIVMDKLGVASRILDGIVQLSTLIVGPNSIVQASLQHVLNETAAEYEETVICDLHRNAKMTFDIFSSCRGLRPTAPQGAMYMMVGIDIQSFTDITSGVDFAKLLLTEENVQVLPGEIFHMPNFFRVVYTKPTSIVEEAAKRIEDFCSRHAK